MHKKTAVLLTILIGSVCLPLSAADENPLAPWKDLINLRPDVTALQAARAQRGRADSPGKIQPIERARGPSVNFDEFSVTLTKLPTSGPTTADELLQYIRLNLNQFMDHSVATFSAQNPQESADWRATDRAPLGTVMQFKIPLWSISGNPLGEGASVITSASSAHTWTFSPVTVGPFDPGEHPVSGNREFGWRKEDGTFGQIYLRGVDRAIGGKLDPGEETIFKGADALWRSFQMNVKAFVEKNGGEAKINEPTIHRPRWNSPDVAALLGKELVDLRVEALLADRLERRDALRRQTTWNEMVTRPQVLKARAWAYLTNALELACADSARFERKYRDEKLPGILFTKKDFDELYARDTARKETIAGSKPLDNCQKYVLRDMQKAEQPVTPKWVTDATARYRKDNPAGLQKLLNVLLEALDQFSEDAGAAYVPTERAEREPQQSSTEHEPRGMNGHVGNVDLSRPYYDQGYGSTLGR